MNYLDLFVRGGLLMYVIGIASVVGLATFIERMLALRESRVAPPAFVKRVTDLVIDGEFEKAIGACSESNTHVAPVFSAILRHRHEVLPLVRDAGEEAGRREAARLERFVGIIGTVASIGPLLGLLGTVTGMISVFQQVAASGVSSPLEMAGGIWEALVTTAFGLGVGIPALMLHRYTLSVVDKRVLSLEDAAVALVDRLDIVEDERAEPEPAKPDTNVPGIVNGD